jgi:tetratricopeptide (TPR) repeat protein
MRKITFLLFAVLFFCACNTFNKAYMDNEIDKALVTGKIISEEGLPLEGVKIKLDQNIETKSDINGRFIFNYLNFGKHSISFEKEDYSKENLKFEYGFKTKKPFSIKIKMFGFNFLINECKELIKAKKYDEAETAFSKLENINPDEESFIYLKGIYYYTRKKYDEAVKIFELLETQNRKFIYYKLPLVDIYEKLGWYRKSAELCYFIGKNYRDEYLNLMRNSALIYREKLKDEKTYDLVIKEFEELEKSCKK